VFQKAMRVFKKMLTVAAMATVLKLVGAASIDPDSFDQELEDMKETVQILTKMGEAIAALGNGLETLGNSLDWNVINADAVNDNTMLEKIKEALGADGFKKAGKAIKNMKSAMSGLSGFIEFMEVADDEEKEDKIAEALGAENLKKIEQVFDEFNEEMDELFPDDQQESNFAVAQTAPSVAATVLLTTTAVWAFA